MNNGFSRTGVSLVVLLTFGSLADELVKHNIGLPQTPAGPRDTAAVILSWYY